MSSLPTTACFSMQDGQKAKIAVMVAATTVTTVNQMRKAIRYLDIENPVW